MSKKTSADRISELEEALCAEQQACVDMCRERDELRAGLQMIKDVEVQKFMFTPKERTELEDLRSQLLATTKERNEARGLLHETETWSHTNSSNELYHRREESKAQGMLISQLRAQLLTAQVEAARLRGVLEQIAWFKGGRPAPVHLARKTLSVPPSDAVKVLERIGELVHQGVYEDTGDGFDGLLAEALTALNSLPGRDKT